MYPSTGTFLTTTSAARINQEQEEREQQEEEQEHDDGNEATSTIAIAPSDCCSPSSSSSSTSRSFFPPPHLQQLQVQPEQKLKTKEQPVKLLDLPTEILQEILCRLTEPRNFVRSCKMIFQLSKSTSLRARYLWLRHGPDQVLTRKLVELHKLTCSILTAPVALLLVAMGASYRDPEEFM
jgi:hypothetical protein